MVTGSGFKPCFPLIGGSAACFLLLSGLLAESGSPAPRVDFNLEVRPILSDNCFACHGPDEKKRQFELRLDTPEGPFQERDLGGPVIVPGDSASSMLYRRVTSENMAWKMPPASSGKELSDRQVELIRSWIDQGAEYLGHWAFQSPKRPGRAEVERTSWPRNPIDSFVLAELEKRGASVSEEADRATLIRRVTYDLTGLPPSMGGGIKAGITLGKTDDFSYNILEDPVHVHDLQATILHCLGIDHKKLTFKYQGRHHRLTDVHGNLVDKLLA